MQFWYLKLLITYLIKFITLNNWFKIKTFILGITVQLDISVILTPYNNHLPPHKKKNIIKKEKKKENTKIWGTRLTFPPH